MLDFLSLIFLTIYPYLFNVTDSLPSDTTTVLTDLTSFKTDSLSFDKIQESPIKIISFKVNNTQIFSKNEVSKPLKLLHKQYFLTFLSLLQFYQKK